jgi:hypothetical protein
MTEIYRPGDKVRARYLDADGVDHGWHNGIVHRVGLDGTYIVCWDKTWPGLNARNSAVEPEDIRRR